MRNTRIGCQRRQPPDRWRSCCCATAVSAVPEYARTAGRSWVVEFMALLDDDFVEVGGRDSDRTAARHMRCRCGEDMDLRAFEKRGPDRELIAYRPFAICPMCQWWIEF